MNEDKSKRLSKKLSWLLRHGALEAGLHMDHAGWARLDEVAAVLRTHPDKIRFVVEHNNKDRYALERGQIRAVQGHSTEGTPVRATALEASWKLYGRDVAWHGTSIAAVRDIREAGEISAMRRTHVHLAETLVSRVGKRANVAVGLRVDTSSLPVFVAPNGVVLTRRLPWSAVTGFVALTRKAKDAAGNLEQEWGIPRILKMSEDGA